MSADASKEVEGKALNESANKGGKHTTSFVDVGRITSSIGKMLDAGIFRSTALISSAAILTMVGDVITIRLNVVNQFRCEECSEVITALSITQLFIALSAVLCDFSLQKSVRSKLEKARTRLTNEFKAKEKERSDRMVDSMSLVVGFADRDIKCAVLAHGIGVMEDLNKPAVTPAGGTCSPVMASSSVENNAVSQANDNSTSRTMLDVESRLRSSVEVVDMRKRLENEMDQLAKANFESSLGCAVLDSQTELCKRDGDPCEIQLIVNMPCGVGGECSTLCLQFYLLTFLSALMLTFSIVVLSYSTETSTFDMTTDVLFTLVLFIRAISIINMRVGVL